jgi:hypothetical protein
MSTKGIRAIEGIAGFLLNVEPFLRKVLAEFQASYIFGGVPGIANRLSADLSLQYQAEEVRARELNNVMELSVDIIASQETARRLTMLRQQIPREQEAAEEGVEGDAQDQAEHIAEPNANARIPNISGLARLPAGFYTFAMKSNHSIGHQA